MQPFGPIAIFDAFPSTAPGGAGIGTAREAETAAQGGPSREESAYRDAPEVYDVEDDGFAGDVRGAEVQQPLSCGDAPGQSGSVFSAGREGEAWWYRLPDLVPVSVLVSGVNPRDNTPVYINYAMQFSGKRGGGATAASKAASRGRAAAGEGGGTKAKRATKKAAAAGAGEARTGHWTTVNGVRTYNTADGRQLTGTRAFTAYSKDTGGSAAPKRRKKKVKRKTSAKRARK